MKSGNAETVASQLRALSTRTFRGQAILVEVRQGFGILNVWANTVRGGREWHLSVMLLSKIAFKGTPEHSVLLGATYIDEAENPAPHLFRTAKLKPVPTRELLVPVQGGAERKVETSLDEDAATTFLLRNGLLPHGCSAQEIAREVSRIAFPSCVRSFEEACRGANIHQRMSVESSLYEAGLFVAYTSSRARVVASDEMDAVRAQVRAALVGRNAPAAPQGQAQGNGESLLRKDGTQVQKDGVPLTTPTPVQVWSAPNPNNAASRVVSLVEETSLL
jgi:hypothetical protein